jgi:hypothetical protein
MPSPHSKRLPNARLSTTAKIPANIIILRESARSANSSKTRFAIYKLLKAVYRVYVAWRCRGVAKRSAHALARGLSIKLRKGMSPFRILIEVIIPKANHKQKSRWVRALEYVYSQNTPVDKFRTFVQRHGGLAGCASLAVSMTRKRRRPRRECIEGDWDD